MTPIKTKVVAVLQARVSSSRLPGKVLKPILGVPMLLRQIERIKRVRRIEKLIVATSNDPADDPIADLCRQNEIACYRGSLNDVLDRFYQAVVALNPEHVVRLTGDCPLTDPQLIDSAIEEHLKGSFDYTCNALEPTYPDGLDVEVVRFETLKTAWSEAKLVSEREHVLPFIHGNPKRFRLNSLKNGSDLSFLRWTVDEPADFDLVTRIYEALYPTKLDFNTADILELLEKKPDLKTLNTQFTRNEGYQMSLQKDVYLKRYQKSQAFLERALKTIPLGSQTFSKSKTHYPAGISPYFIKRALGSQAWDLDGNQYTDFVNSLCAVNLGYNDPDVMKAVTEQLQDGVIFTLPHPIETLVAEKIVEMVPCAEMVRFGKNGSDATAGAIRLARAYTHRDHVAVCGYHGWQDWYIGSTLRNRGVPKATRDLTHTFAYNNLDSLQKLFKEFPDQIAAVIMEPMNISPPEKGFLEGVKELAQKNGSVLVFDETITGFRFANGGAQELLGVTPDLATFGKGMANGYPVSAITGKAEIMRLMEEIFFSFTFGGETLSLAAALATMTKMQKEPVVKTLYSKGEKLLSGARALASKHGMDQILSFAGNPTWSFLIFKDVGKYTHWQTNTFFLQEIFARGILNVGTHNMSYAHSDQDVEKLLSAYNEIFPVLKDLLEHSTLEKNLFTKPLEPLFKLR